MTNGMTNTFAPLNQAWQGLNQTIVKAPQIRRQRRQANLQNQLTQAKLQSQKRQMRQQRGLQNYLQQRQQQTQALNQQREQLPPVNQLMPSVEQVTEVPTEEAVTPNIMGGGMPGLQQEQQTQNQLMNLAGFKAQGQQKMDPTRAQIEYWRQTDPSKAQEIMTDVFKQAETLHNAGQPEAAAQLVEQKTGLQTQYEGGEDYQVKRWDGQIFRISPTKGAEQWNPQTGDWERAEEVPQEQEDMSAKEEEIQKYLQGGIANTRDQATKLAYDQYKLGQDRFGRSAIIDVTTGEVIKPLGEGKVQQQQAGQQRQQQQKREPFISVEEAAEGVGPISSVKQMMNNVIGPFTPGQLFENTEQARNKLRIFRQRIKPYLMVSSRGAVYEQQNIEKFLPNPDQFFTDPDATKDQLQNLHSMINATIEKKQELIDQGDITADQMRTFNQDIKKLQTALSYMPDEEVLFEPETDQQQMSKNIQDMSREELQALNPENLSNQELDTLEQRLNEIEGNQ